MVTAGAEGVVMESPSETLKVTDAILPDYKEKTRELYKNLYADPNIKSAERNEDTGAVKATYNGRKQSKPKERVSLSYKVGEDTKGCTKLSCGTKREKENVVTYTGKQLEERCQDVLFNKGCVCVLKPDEEKDPKTKNVKRSVDCFFMKDGMDTPVKADIKSPTLKDGEKQITAKQVGNIIGHGLEQAEDDDAEYMILYYDNPDYYDGEAVKNGITMYAKNDNIENKQVKNFIIVVNDEQPVDIISIDQLSV